MIDVVSFASRKARPRRDAQSQRQADFLPQPYSRRGGRWASFWSWWGSLGTVGLFLTLFLTLMFWAASEGGACQRHATEYLCNGGGTLYAALPMIGYVAMLFVSPLAGAMVSEWLPGGRKLSPEWGFAVGILMWWLVPFLLWHNAIAGYRSPW